MKIRYRILSAVVEQIPVKAMVGDREIDAQIPGVTIDAQSVDGGMCHTFRLQAEDAPDFDRYHEGAIVVATFELEQEED